MSILAKRLERLRIAFRHWRRDVKARLPYVRRREFATLRRRFDALTAAMASGLMPANSARIKEIKPLANTRGRELCLFVTHMVSPTLKTHVQEHIQHFLAANIDVVLIANTDLNPDEVQVSEALLQRLSGFFVRENLGFDFAAWGHLLQMLPARDKPVRLYLVNDSVAGPLTTPLFQNMLERVRASTADLIGLTESVFPRPHLQSFFLVFNEKLIQSLAFDRVLGNIVCFPSKDSVIDVYETWLTETFAQQGFKCEAMIPAMGRRHDANDTYFRWNELVERGFPYVKVSLLREKPNDSEITQLVPKRFLRDII